MRFVERQIGHGEVLLAKFQGYAMCHDIITILLTVSKKIKYVQIRFFRWNSWFDLKLVQISRHKSPILDACVRLSYNTFKKGAGVRWTYVWHEAGDLVCSQLLMIYFTYISLVSVGFLIWKYCFVLLIDFCFWLSFICVSHLYLETDEASSWAIFTDCVTVCFYVFGVWFTSLNNTKK